MAETTATKPTANKQSKLKQGLSALVWRVDRELQWFQGNQPKPKTAPKRRVACLVLARGLYSESWQSYSIRSQRALQKVLKQKYGNAENIHFYIGPWQNSQRKVLVIELNSTAHLLKYKAYTLLPESLVLSAALTDGLYEVSDGEQHYFLHKQEQQWQTLLRSRLVNTVDKARLALGCSADKPVQQLTNEQLVGLIPRGVSKLGLSYLKQGQQQRQRGTSLPWQKLGLTVASVGVIYLLLSSAYLVVQNSMIANRLDDVMPKVGALLEQQQQLQQAQQTLNELSGQFVNERRINVFWEVFIAAQGEDNSINFLQANDTSLTLGGQATEALPLLRKLYDLPQIASAEFASPVRNSRTGQQYRINMVLEEGGNGYDN